MASLKETVVSGRISATEAASGAQDLVRLQELLTALAGKAASGHGHEAADITGLANAVGAALAAALSGSGSIAVTVDGGCADGGGEGG